MNDPTNLRQGSTPDRERSRGLIAAVLALAFALATLGSAQEYGYLELRTVALEGATVFLDASDVGQVEDGQLLVSAIYPGRYALRIEAQGQFPQLLEIEVQAGRVTPVFVQGALAAPAAERVADIADAAMTGTSGNVVLQCFPMQCSLAVLEAPPWARASGVVFDKAFGDVVLNVAGLAEGSYRFRVLSGDGSASIDLTTGLCHGETVGVLVDFTRAPIELTASASVHPECPPLPVVTTEEEDEGD